MVRASPDRPLQLWLPALAGSIQPIRCANGCGAADPLPPGPAGDLAGLGDYFACGIEPAAGGSDHPRFLAGDAAGTTLAVRRSGLGAARLNGARLLACGSCS